MEEKIFNQGKFNRRNLKDKKTFRWGGIEHKFKKTAKEWRDEFCFSEAENPYIKCSCCGRDYADDDILYAGFFTVKEKSYECRYQLKTLCKECAYRISDKVIESDEE